MTKRYTVADKAAGMALLAANEGCVEVTAADLGLAPDILAGWAAQKDEGLKAATVVKKARLADLFEEAAKAALVRSGAVIEEATYHQLMSAAGMATEKMRLLREQSTVINDDKTPTIRVVFDDIAPAKTP